MAANEDGRNLIEKETEPNGFIWEFSKTIKT